MGEKVVHGHDCRCPGHGRAPLQQSLDELQFERSVAGAARMGDVATVKRLLDRGANVDGEGEGPRYTPLHYTARGGHLEVCKLLLQRGAQISVETPAGRATALHRAASGGSLDVLRLLLLHGADASARDADLQTPLHKAHAQDWKEGAALLEAACPTAAHMGDLRGRLPIDCSPSGARRAAAP